jgi:putative sigma-54 modulation protein
VSVSSKLEVKLSFKGLDSTDAIKSYAEKRISKLSKHLHKLISCEFVFMVEKTMQIAQLHVISGDFEARAESQTESLYSAIDEVVDKMVQQTRKYKEKTTNHAGLPHHNQEVEETTEDSDASLEEAETDDL